EPVKQTSIPAELLLSLTSTVSKNTQGHTAHHRSCEVLTVDKIAITHIFVQNDGIRRPDGVWHYPLGRTKYKYFLEQPTSLTEAGNIVVKQTFKHYRTLYVCAIIHILHLWECSVCRRPSGRLEVIQLMRMMDDMLEKAGVDQQNEELTDLCQNLLELVKTEQNIYNIVFHELIRQVTVGCAERGQLLAKLRQRYQSLLERIPQCLKKLHTEVVAQRALDRRLIEQIYHIKASIQQINIVVQGYHHLYELHRTRLEEQLEQLTEDRDHWSRFTFNLALKVQEAVLLCSLFFCVQCSFFISLCNNKQRNLIFRDMLQLTNKWKNQLTTLMLFVKKIQHAQFEQIFSLKEGLKKWHLHIRTQNR
uniref:Axonemal dynein light chain domain containing 1 n=1 Tax=Xiphophorus couchianus TaxID=32473 RepID=A0A3B5M182_9TELE